MLTQNMLAMSARTISIAIMIRSSVRPASEGRRLRHIAKPTEEGTGHLEITLGLSVPVPERFTALLAADSRFSSATPAYDDLGRKRFDGIGRVMPKGGVRCVEAR